MVRDTGPDGPGRTDHGRSQKLSGTGIFRRNLRAPLRKKEEIPWTMAYGDGPAVPRLSFCHQLPSGGALQGSEAHPAAHQTSGNRGKMDADDCILR